MEQEIANDEFFNVAAQGNQVTFVYDGGNGEQEYLCDAMLLTCDPDGDENPIASDDPEIEGNIYNDLGVLVGLMNGDIDLEQSPFTN